MEPKEFQSGAGQLVIVCDGAACDGEEGGGGRGGVKRIYLNM